MKAGRADVAVQTFFGAKEHEEKTGGAFEVTDPKLMPKETLNVVGSEKFMFAHLLFKH